MGSSSSGALPAGIVRPITESWGFVVVLTRQNLQCERAVIRRQAIAKVSFDVQLRDAKGFDWLMRWDADSRLEFLGALAIFCKSLQNGFPKQGKFSEIWTSSRTGKTRTGQESVSLGKSAAKQKSTHECRPIAFELEG
jgi:hypothetical protein